MIRSRYGLVCIVLWLAVSIPAHAQPAQTGPAPNAGSVCVLASVPLAEVRGQSPSVPPAAKEYTLRLDGGPWVPLSSKSSRLLDAIPYAGRHKVVIRGDGKPFVAFSFSFAEYESSDLCLVQNDMYLDWMLVRSQDWFKVCRCKGVAPAAWAPSTLP